MSRSQTASPLRAQRAPSAVPMAVPQSGTHHAPVHPRREAESETARGQSLPPSHSLLIFISLIILELGSSRARHWMRTQNACIVFPAREVFYHTDSGGGGVLRRCRFYPARHRLFRRALAMRAIFCAAQIPRASMAAQAALTDAIAALWRVRRSLVCVTAPTDGRSVLHKSFRKSRSRAQRTFAVSLHGC